MKQEGLSLLLKKAFDRTAAAVGLVATAPLLGAAAVAVRATMGAPVFFTQRRAGLHGKPFDILKLRTMNDARDANGELLPDAERMTKVGQILRSTSLDELPQLVCVLRGELSLVGPRPLPTTYLERYTPEEMRRHDVLPGITGMPAVSGRNLLSWDDRFRLDLWYVDHWSLWLDAKILLKTAWKVVAREGVATADHVTSPELRPEAKKKTVVTVTARGGTA